MMHGVSNAAGGVLSHFVTCSVAAASVVDIWAVAQIVRSAHQLIAGGRSYWQQVQRPRTKRHASTATAKKPTKVDKSCTAAAKRSTAARQSPWAQRHCKRLQRSCWLLPRLLLLLLQLLVSLPAALCHC